MSRSFRIRPFRPADGAALAQLHRESILAVSDAYYTRLERESWAAGLKATHYDPGEAGTIDVAADGEDHAVAFCHSTDDEVLGLYVHPQWQRTGVGTDLMRRAEARIAAAGHAVARVHAANSAVLFYERLGYAIVETTSHTTRGGLILSSTRLTRQLGRGAGAHRDPCAHSRRVISQ